METMFSALESSRLARTALRARDTASLPSIPASEGMTFAFLLSAVLSVFPSEQEQPKSPAGIAGQSIDMQSRIVVSRLGRSLNQDGNQDGVQRLEPLRMAVEDRSERRPWMKVHAGARILARRGASASSTRA